MRSQEEVVSRELKRRLDCWWLDSIVKPDFDFTKALFEHYYKERNVFMLLHRQGLSYLNLESIRSACGPKPGMSGIQAYQAAFIAYGLYGWIEQWFERGMKESPEEMSELLKRAGAASAQKEQ